MCGQDFLWQDWIWIDFSGPQSPNHTWHHHRRKKKFFHNSAKIHITSSITIFFRKFFLVSQDLFPKDLIEVGHVKRRGSSAASRQMSLYRSTLELQSWEKFRLWNLIVLCRMQFFRVSSEFERQFLSIFEHKHHRALDIWVSSEYERQFLSIFEHEHFG